MNLSENKWKSNIFVFVQNIAMKLKELNKINCDSAFIESRLKFQKEILLALTIGGSILVLLWQLFDSFNHIQNSRELFWLRTFTVAVYIVNLVAANLRSNERAYKQHLVAGFYFGTIYCMLLTVFTGASQSPYWYGLFFILIGWFIILPYSYKELIIHGSIFIIIFISGLYLQQTFKIEPAEIAKIIFLYTGTLFIGIFSAVNKNKADAINYQSKFEIKETNEELATSIEELRAEMENHQETYEKLKEKQQFLDNILSNAPLVIWSIDLDGNFTFSQYKGDQGVEPGERVGKSALEVYKGTEVEVFLKKVLNGEIQNDIIKLGSIYYDTRVSPIYNVKGEKTGYMGVSLDITERIRNENNLKKFQLVLDQAPGAVFIIDKNSNFEYINPEFTRISGYTESDLLGKNLNETLYKGKVPESRKEIIETISSGKTWQGELLTINKNGSNYWANTIAAPYKDEKGNVDGFIVIQQDFTEKKKMETALKESENLYRTLIEKSQDGVAISQDGRILLANQAFCDLLGYEMEEMLKTEPESLLAPEDKEMVLDLHYKRLRGESSSMKYPAKFLHKSGKEIILELNAATVLMNGKNASFVTMRDITERSKMEEALKTSEDKYRKLFEAEMDAIFLIDIEDGQIIEANPAASAIYGYSHDELLKLKNTDLSAEPEKTYSAMKQKQSLVPIRNHRKKDGTVFSVELSAGFTIFNSKNVQIVTARDITERIEMQKALKESESKYKTLVENSLDGILIIRDNKILFANLTLCRMLDYNDSELYTIPSVNIIHPDDRHKAFDIAEKRKSGDFSTFNEIFRMLTKNGEIKECDTSSTLIEYDGSWASFFTVHDITESKRMQNALKESEEKYRMLVENSQDGICIAQGDYFKFVNTAMCKMLGYTAEEIYSMPGMNIIPPEEQKRVLKIHKDRMDGKISSINYNLQLIAKDKSTVEVEAQSTTFIYEGQPAGFFTLHNITHSKKIQAALRESEKRYRELTEMLPQTVYELDLQGNITYMNETGLKAFGLEKSDYGRSAFNFIAPEEHEKMRFNMKKTLEESFYTPGNQYTAIRKNGDKFPAMIFASPLNIDGEITGTRGIILDMTEHLAMQKALRQSEEKYKSLVENSQDGICIIQEGVFKYANKSLCLMLGYTSSELVDLEVLEIIEDSEREQIVKLLKKRSKSADSLMNYTVQFKRKDGRIIDAAIESSSTEYEGKPASFDTIHDITESKRIQAALVESETKYRELVETTNSIIIKWDKEFRISFINEYGLKFFGYSRQEIIGKSVVGTIVPPSEAYSGRNLTKLMDDIFKNPAKYEQNINENMRKNGERVWLSWNNTAIKDNDGNIINMFSVGTDITERRKNEEELRITKDKLQKLNSTLEKKVKETAEKLTEANTHLIRLQKENLQSQFEVLRQQVNPHFLFNSLNVLTSLIKLEPDLAEKFTEHLSKVYRYVLENKDNDLVELNTELEFLDAYVFLLHIRFMDKIEIVANIAEEKKTMLVLPLALQLLIENAIKHNSMSKKAPLKIEIFIDNENILNIVNNLQERESHMVSTGVGLKNIEHRYHLLEMPAPEFYKTETHFIAKIPLK